MKLRTIRTEMYSQQAIKQIYRDFQDQNKEINKDISHKVDNYDLNSKFIKCMICQFLRNFNLISGKFLTIGSTVRQRAVPSRLFLLLLGQMGHKLVVLQARQLKLFCGPAYPPSLHLKSLVISPFLHSTFLVKHHKFFICTCFC